MALSLAFGVIFASAITLFVVPCLYMVAEDLNLWLHGMGRRRAEERIAAARADQQAGATESSESGWDDGRIEAG